MGYAAHKREDGSIDTQTTDGIDRSMLHFWHSSAFMGTIKVFWLSQFTRYILRPQRWFADSLKYIVNYKLRRLTCKGVPLDGMGMQDCVPDEGSSSCCTSDLQTHISGPYASLHIRYGMKVIEQPLQPLKKYMNYMAKKAPHVRDIFVSTETEWVIHSLAQAHTDYTFYYIDYARVEDLKLSEIDPNIDYTREFIYSFVNLYIAVEADFFVGSLTSSWCVLIHQMERTRGDGGAEYFSVDLGSQYTSCF
jgi:hypothetical protein